MPKRGKSFVPGKMTNLDWSGGRDGPNSKARSKQKHGGSNFGEVQWCVVLESVSFGRALGLILARFPPSRGNLNRYLQLSTLQENSMEITRSVVTVGNFFMLLAEGNVAEAFDSLATNSCCHRPSPGKIAH